MFNIHNSIYSTTISSGVRLNDMITFKARNYSYFTKNKVEKLL